MLLRRPFLLLMLAAFLPLAALSVALGILALRAERDTIERDALERVRLLSDAMARDLVTQLDVLRVLAQSRDFDDGVTQAEFTELARRIKDEMPAWRAIRFTGIDAQILAEATFAAETASGARSGSVVDIDSHRAVVETKKPIIGKVLLGPFGRNAFALRAPVIRDGTVKYVISAVLSPETIRDRFLLPGLPEHWIATVIDGSGNIVARSVGTEEMVGKPASENALAARASGVAEGIYAGFVLEGVPTISAYRMLPVGNWSVHVGVPRNVFMAPLRRSLWMIGLGLAATLLLAVMFLWLLLREIKLRRREELGMENVRRLEALGRMTGGVAHDFNNLLMIMQGGAEGIKRRAADPERQKTYADAILAAVQRGQSLTRQLLAFAQRGAHEPVSFRIQDRPELKELLSRSVRENVEVHLLVPSDTWAVQADPNALEVGLINLAVNASDAMPKGGRLTVGAANIVMVAGREGNPGLEGSFVAIAVQDTGTGIAPEHVDRIFEPFFTTKGRGKGTGLGLSQVYGFAQQSGGAITVKSKQGEGCTFTLFLPRSLQTPVSLRPPAPAQAVGGRGRILLVEDNLPVAEVTAAMLGDAGYEVIRSNRAAAALELLKANRNFDLVLSDIVMDEGISGLELAQQVRAAWPDLPVVLMTGYSEALKGVDLAEMPVVFKPFTQQEMLAALSLARQRREAAAAG